MLASIFFDLYRHTLPSKITMETEILSLDKCSTRKISVDYTSNVKCPGQSERTNSDDFICIMLDKLTNEEKSGKIGDSKKSITVSWAILLKDKLVSRYLKLLETDALATKCIISGAISLLGDFLAQAFENRSEKAHFDKLRAFALVFESTFLTGPLMHYAFDFMEYLVPIDTSVSSSDDSKTLTASQFCIFSKWGASFLHVAADILILGPIYVVSMMLTSAVIEGNWSTLWLEFKIDFLPTLWASTLSSVSFLPIQLFAFRMLPVHLRLLYMNMQDIIWNAVVSYYAHRSRGKD